MVVVGVGSHAAVICRARAAIFVLRKLEVWKKQAELLRAVTVDRMESEQYRTECLVRRDGADKFHGTFLVLPATPQPVVLS